MPLYNLGNKILEFHVFPQGNDLPSLHEYDPGQLKTTVLSILTVNDSRECRCGVKPTKKTVLKRSRSGGSGVTVVCFCPPTDEMQAAPVNQRKGRKALSLEVIACYGRDELTARR